MGKQHKMPGWNPRNTNRARSLRRTATPAERMLWRSLARSALGAKFSRQMPVGPWFADFLCRELKLVIELDGHSHDVQPERDRARDADLRTRGYTVLRFTNGEALDETEAVARAIQQEIDRLRSNKCLPPAREKRDQGWRAAHSRSRVG